MIILEDGIVVSRGEGIDKESQTRSKVEESGALDGSPTIGRLNASPVRLPKLPLFAASTFSYTDLLANEYLGYRNRWRPTCKDLCL